MIRLFLLLIYWVEVVTTGWNCLYYWEDDFFPQYDRGDTTYFFFKLRFCFLSFMGKEWKKCQTLFFWAPKSRQMVIAAMRLKDAYSLEGQ